jgi:hypothetical protein
MGCDIRGFNIPRLDPPARAGGLYGRVTSPERERWDVPSLSHVRQADFASSRACWSLAFGCTPMNCCTSRPPWKIMIVGMLATL